jgi:hypothetical protein
MNSEQKKFIFALVLICGAVVAAFWLWPRSDTVPNSMLFVCVETGKTARLSRDDVPSIMPVENPSTGNRTLLPAYTDDDGKLRLIERYASVLHEPAVAKVNKYVDPQTYEVLESPRE